MPTYALTDTGAGDFEQQGVEPNDTWIAPGLLARLGIIGGGLFDVGFNFAIPADADSVTLFSTAVLTFSVAFPSGSPHGQDMILRAYKNQSLGGVISIGGAVSTIEQIELGRVAIPDPLVLGDPGKNNTLDVTIDVGAFNHVFRNQNYTASVAALILSVDEGQWVTGQEISILTLERNNAGSPPALLVTTEHPKYTGWLEEATSQGRNVTDDRYGMPIKHTDRVRDGFRPGLQVRADDVDDPEGPAVRSPFHREGESDES